MAGEKRGRVLIVLSGADQLRMKNGTILKTGYYLNELSDPLGHLHRAGSGEQKTQALARVETREDLMRPMAIERITDDELVDYAGLFVPGGHAPMADLAGMPQMKPLFEHFHRGFKPTCLSITQDRPWIYKGYRMTGFPEWMDWVARYILRRLPGRPPFSITRNLKRAGGIVRHNRLPGRPVHHRGS